MLYIKAQSFSYTAILILQIKCDILPTKRIVGEDVTRH